MRVINKFITWLLLTAMIFTLIPTSVGYAAETSQTKAVVNVPSISAPFTTHPTVFLIEDNYQIIFATNSTGLSWVEVAGAKFYDSQNGLLNYSSKFHKIVVPQAILDATGSYSINFRHLAERPAYNPAPASTAIAMI